MLRVDAEDRKIGLSRKNLHGGVPEEELAAAGVAPDEEPTAEKAKPQRELRGGTGAAGPLIQMPDAEKKEETVEEAETRFSLTPSPPLPKRERG